MIVVLIIWNVVLTVALALAVLANLGKFSRIEREVFENLSHELFTVFENLKNLDTQVKTLEGKLETLPKTLEGVLQQIENLQAGFQNLAETQTALRKDVDLLFKADKEYSVLTAPLAAEPAAKPRGGRPRKGEM